MDCTVTPAQHLKLARIGKVVDEFEEDRLGGVGGGERPPGVHYRLFVAITDPKQVLNHDIVAIPWMTELSVLQCEIPIFR